MKDSVTFTLNQFGLILTISEEGAFTDQLENCRSIMIEHPEFAAEGFVTVDLGWRELDEHAIAVLLEHMNSFCLLVEGIISSSLNTRNAAESMGIKTIIGRLGISEHHSRFLPQHQSAPEKLRPPSLPEKIEMPPPFIPSDSQTSARPVAQLVPKTARKPVLMSPAQPVLKPAKKPILKSSGPSKNPSHKPMGKPSVKADEKKQKTAPLKAKPYETVMIKRTIRTGEILEVRGNAVIMGDIEKDAEVTAYGDIVVLGAVKGELYAGCEGDENAVIVWAHLTPQSISIANLQIVASQLGNFVPVGLTKASVRGRSIVIEPYSV